jgi:putative membrane protein
MSTKVSQSLLCLALASVTSTAIAADAERTAPPPAIFVEKAAQAGMTEIAAAKAALSKSRDPGILSFAQRMVMDHGAANLELATLAKAKGIDAPSTLDAEHKAALDQITSKSGPEFDRSYAQHMNMDHSKAIALFESATKTSDPELAGFAKKTLPTLREHKLLAEKLPGKQPVTGSSAGG